MPLTNDVPTRRNGVLHEFKRHHAKHLKFYEITYLMLSNVKAIDDDLPEIYEANKSSARGLCENKIIKTINAKYESEVFYTLKTVQNIKNDIWKLPLPNSVRLSLFFKLVPSYRVAKDDHEGVTELSTCANGHATDVEKNLMFRNFFCSVCGHDLFVERK